MVILPRRRVAGGTARANGPNATAVEEQVTTLMRPLLWREPRTPPFVGAKMFFMEAFDQVTQAPRATPPGSDTDSTPSK